MAHQPVRTSSLVRTSLVSFALLGFGLMLGFGLRTYCLGCQSLWFDEGFSAWVARLGFSAGLQYVVRWDAHPPLYYWLLTSWRAVAGGSELSLRFPSVVCGMLLLPVIYQVAKKLDSRSMGVIALLLAAVAPVLIYHSQQARMYAPTTFLSALASYWLLCAWRDGGSWKNIGLFATTTGLSLFTLYYAIFPLIGQAALLAWASWRCVRQGDLRFARVLRRIGLATVALAVLASPWTPSFLQQASASAPGAWRALVPLPQMLLRSAGTLLVGEADPTGGRWWLWVCGATSVLFLLFASWRSRSPEGAWTPASSRLISGGRLWIPFVAVPLLMVGLGSYIRPIFDVRYLVVVYPALALALAKGLSATWRLQPVIGLVGVLVVLSGQALSLNDLYVSDRYAMDDYRQAVYDLERGIAPGDTVVVSSGANFPAVANYLTLPIRWKGQLQDYERQALPRSPDRETGITLVQVGTIGTGESLITPEDAPLSIDQAMVGLTSIERTSERVWFFRMYDTISDRRTLVRSWLGSQMLMAFERYYRGPSYMQLYLFVPKDPGVVQPRIQHAYDLHFSNGADVRGFSLHGEVPAPGGTLPLTLYWSDDRPIDKDYQIFVHLVSRTGKTVAQSDGAPLGGHYPTSQWEPGVVIPERSVLPIPSDAPPGEYRLSVGLYDLGSMQRVKIGDEDAASLGPVVVHPSPLDPSQLKTDAAAELEDGMRLLGARVERPSSQAEWVVSLYWGCRAKPSGDYTVFVHVLDEAGRVVDQSDGEPVGGNFPTSLCQPGDTIEDAHRLSVPSIGRAQNYQVLVGLYQRQTGKRLRTMDGRDAIVVGGGD